MPRTPSPSYDWQYLQQHAAGTHGVTSQQQPASGYRNRVPEAQRNSAFDTSTAAAQQQHGGAPGSFVDTGKSVSSAFSSRSPTLCVYHVFRQQNACRAQCVSFDGDAKRDGIFIASTQQRFAQ